MIRARLFRPVRIPVSPHADLMAFVIVSLGRWLTVRIEIAPKPVLLAVNVLPL
jgi:hypothetical protein